MTEKKAREAYLQFCEENGLTPENGGTQPAHQQGFYDRAVFDLLGLEVGE